MLRLRELRKKCGITMKELGARIGVAESTISQYETGKRQPDFETLLKLGEYFGVTVDFILGAEKAPTADSSERNAEKVNIIKIAGRDGSYQERELTDEQMAAIKAIIAQIPNVPDDF